MKLDQFKNIHFIGIGGISMSSLAEILMNKGYKVSGSDMNKSPLTDKLAAMGAEIYIGQCAENIKDDYDLVVYTAAIGPDNAELKMAKAKGLCVIDRAELVGMLMLTYDKPISIAGTHGKTTTSSIVTEIFLNANTDPTISIGGILPTINGNFRMGSNEYFVLETCEYCDSFLKFNPHSAIILNVELDHTDYFKDLDHIYSSFNRFAKRISPNGFLVINGDIENVEDIIEDLDCEVITYGSNKDFDWSAKNIRLDNRGCGCYTAMNCGNPVAEVQLNIPGIHNVYNSLAAFALAYEYGLEVEDIVNGIAKYTGVDRRFQHKGEFNGVTVVDDYAHHPTEIAATLGSAEACDINNLWVVFQPHTYTRTYDLLQDFAQVLANAQNVVLVDIYAAREKDTGIVSSKTLEEAINIKGGNAVYVGGFKEAENYLRKKCTVGDMVITMGAGDVFKIGENLVK